jgi:hypothetical protein
MLDLLRFWAKALALKAVHPADMDECANSSGNEVSAQASFGFS